MDEPGRISHALLGKVRAEFSLTAVYNLRRAINILGVERLTEAVDARNPGVRSHLGLRISNFAPEKPSSSGPAFPVVWFALTKRERFFP